MIDKTTLHFTTQQCPSTLVEINEILRGKNFVFQGWRLPEMKLQNNTKWKCLTPIAERILWTNFTKTEMPIHSLPEWILRTNFTKWKCQYTHCQNKFSELNFTKMECQYTHCENEISKLILQRKCQYTHC